MSISQFISANSQYLKMAKSRKRLRNRFPDEFRESVAVAAGKGISIAELARVADVHPTTVRKWIQEKSEMAKEKFIAVQPVNKPDRQKEIKIQIPAGTKVIISSD